MRQPSSSFHWYLTSAFFTGSFYYESTRALFFLRAPTPIGLRAGRGGDILYERACPKAARAYLLNGENHAMPIIARRKLLLLALIVLYGVGCAVMPITGRRSLSIVPSSELQAMSLTQYDEFLKTNQLSSDAQATAMVKRVGGRIQKAVEQFFAEQGDAARLEGYAWEFNLVQDDTVNAWCMPGGKVVVYTGLLPVAQDETGLAVVMGHEIAHAVANHGGERMSQEMLAQMGGKALGAALEKKTEQTKTIFMGAYGLGTKFGALLPYSRLHESEADHMGLVFMAMAGYDPRQAAGFWRRMSQSGGGGAPMEFLSTHPADDKRAAKLEALLPEAMKYYKGN